MNPVLGTLAVLAASGLVFLLIQWGSVVLLRRVGLLCILAADRIEVRHARAAAITNSQLIARLERTA